MKFFSPSEEAMAEPRPHASGASRSLLERRTGGSLGAQGDTKIQLVTDRPSDQTCVQNDFNAGESDR